MVPIGFILLLIICVIYGLSFKPDFQLKTHVRSEFNLAAEPNILQRPEIESRIASFF